MTRWILAAVAIVAIGAAFAITSPGWLALALFVAFAAGVGSFVGFLSARVDAVSQGQSSRELELLLTSRKPGAPARPAPGARPVAAARPVVSPAKRRDTGGNESFLYAAGAGAGAAATHDHRSGDASGDAGGDGGGGNGGGGD